jgi:hypothetical protein
MVKENKWSGFNRNLYIHTIAQKFHTVFGHGFQNKAGGVFVFFGKNAVHGFHQKHFRSKTGKSLGHFTADGTGTDDSQPLGQFCQAVPAPITTRL